MPDLTKLADCSEYQDNIDAGVYIDAGHTCLIVRAHNGHRPDKYWPQRRDYLRRFPFDAIGFYQYMVESRPAAEQANEMVATVGPLRANEFVVCDSEEGTGSQIDRVNAWFAVTDLAYGKPGTLYASESWFADRLGGSARWSRRPRWMAAYRSTEPSAPHELWQYNDHSNLPGISGDGGDGNLFHGSGKDFAKTFAGVTSTSPGPKPPTNTQSLASVVKDNGAIEIFEELPSGEVIHKWQPAANSGPWSNFQSMGTPGK